MPMTRQTDIQEIQIYLEQVYKHPGNASTKFRKIFHLSYFCKRVGQLKDRQTYKKFKSIWN